MKVQKDKLDESESKVSELMETLKQVSLSDLEILSENHLYAKMFPKKP